MASIIRDSLDKYRVGYTHNIYSMLLCEFNRLDVQPWQFNRPPTMNRVPEIHEWMKTSGRMDGVISLAYIQGEGLRCYEGNHRRLALAGLNPDSMAVIFEVMWDATNDKVKDEFNRLNKAIAVPQMYVVETSREVRGKIEEIVKAFETMWEDHVSKSKKANRPNFTRDGFKDEIFHAYTELEVPIAELIERIQRVNQKYAAKSDAEKAKLSQAIREKCTKTGLWLFAWSSSLSLNDLQ